MPDADLTDPRIVDDLDDHAFLLTLPGGARDSTGRTFPRALRVGPHHNPSRRRVDLSRKRGKTLESASSRLAGQDKAKGSLNKVAVARVLAQVNAGSLPLSRSQREEAWRHLAQHAVELEIPVPPKRF